jgi:hypothetical protein
MRWPRLRLRRQAPENPEPPLGVVLHWRGRAIPCGVVRDESQDEHGYAAWMAVPLEQAIIEPGDQIRISAAVLPDRTVLIAGLTLATDDEEAGSWPGSR